MTRHTTQGSHLHEFQEKMKSGGYYFSIIFFLYLVNGAPVFSMDKPDTDEYVHVAHEFIQNTFVAHLTGPDGSYRYIDMPFSPNMQTQQYRERVISEAVDMLKQKG